MASLRRCLTAALLMVVACGCSASSSSSTGSAADQVPGFEGAWLGTLEPGARIQLRLERNPDGVLGGVFDSIDEGVMGLPLTVAEDGAALVVALDGLDVSATLTLSGEDTLSGSVASSGDEVPVILTRQEEPFAFDRPQEPEPPFPYVAEEVTFPNAGAGFALAGTLTIPDGRGPFPAVVLVSGSGPQDRDEQVAGHRPFLVLADHLTRVGIAVLRYDDRGFGASGGSQDGATSADFAADAAAALDYLVGRPEIDPARVGIVGHSEGGLVAPLVAVEHREAAFVVMLAGPGTPGVRVISEQNRLIAAAEGVPDDVLDWQSSWTEAALAVAASDVDAATAREAFGGIAADAAASLPPLLVGQVSRQDVLEVMEAYLDPWMRWFLAYDPAPTLQAVPVPVLALFGEADLQVPAATNDPAVQAALAGGVAPSYEVETIPGVNHLFQGSATGAVSEYVELTETMAPAVLERIAEWILSIVGR